MSTVVSVNFEKSSGQLPSSTQDARGSGGVDTDTVWTWLAHVPDPEVPVVSVIDLGIVRDVRREGDAFTIVVTPTYSGCPATAVIAIDIQNALAERGLEQVEIETRLSPIWTTDWITAEGRQKLSDYGIAPPISGVNCAGALKGRAGCNMPPLWLSGDGGNQPVWLHPL